MLNVDSSSLEAAVAALRVAASEIAAELAALESRSAVLAAAWSGDAQLAYADAHRRWNTGLNEMRGLLDSASDAAAAAEERYVATERGIAASWSL